MLIVIIILICWLFYTNISQCNVDRTYLDKLNLHFTGVIKAIDRVNGSNGFDIVKVRIISTNKEYYDPRGQYKNYYCLIKNGYAELYQGTPLDCLIGDIVEVDTKKRIFTVHKPHGDEYEEILINNSDRYYEYLKKNHQNF